MLLVGVTDGEEVDVVTGEEARGRRRGPRRR